MNNTPETDAFRDSQFTDRADEMEKLYDLAEKLERERDEAKAEWYSLQDAFEDSCDKIEKLERERDKARERERVAIVSWEEERQRALREGQRVVEARQQNAKLRDLVEKAIDCVTHIDDCRHLIAELDQIKEGAK